MGLLFPIFTISISLVVLILTALNIKIEMSHLLIFGGGLIALLYLPIELYLKREMKRRRIVYNKEYMQDRQGTVLTVIYTLTGVIVPVLMFLAAWGVKKWA
jgi:Na+/H+ antiporter NhaA